MQRQRVDMPNSMSEDDLFKTLLKRKPETQAQVWKEAERTVPEPKYEKPVETNPPPRSVDIEPIVESIRNLTASVNTLYGLVKTVIVPVLVLILIVGIAILVKSL